MRTLFLFLILTTAAVASDRRREPSAIISTPSGGYGAGGFYSRAGGGLIDTRDGTYLREFGGFYVSQRGEVYPRLGGPEKKRKKREEDDGLPSLFNRREDMK